ncbi:hypothetical protein ACHAXN_003124 [Cyclotella atomus]|jgi:thiol-disulfide isomerase/thioredoxin
MSVAPTKSVDWRCTLLGDNIRINSQNQVDDRDVVEDADADEEAPSPSSSLTPTKLALDPAKYDYIALFIGANYCPHCRELAPTVVKMTPILQTIKRCKVIFVSNDRDEDNFEQSCVKNAGIDVMPYNLEKTQAIRDMFGLATIPAFLILRNEDFGMSSPTLVTNARHQLVIDPSCASFPWVAETDSEGPVKKHVPFKERIIIQGKWGRWYQLGHYANPEKPDEMYMDEHAVRIRGGLLNIITWIALMNVLFLQKETIVYCIFPLVFWEMLSASTFGLTPLAPIGTLAAVMATIFWSEPHWKPAKPKRFAWWIGLFMVSLYFTIFSLREYIDNYRIYIAVIVGIFNLATWLESAAGFCIGCFIYNKAVVPMFKLDECVECKF